MSIVGIWNTVHVISSFNLITQGFQWKYQTGVLRTSHHFVLSRQIWVNLPLKTLPVGGQATDRPHSLNHWSPPLLSGCMNRSSMLCYPLVQLMLSVSCLGGDVLDSFYEFQVCAYWSDWARGQFLLWPGLQMSRHLARLGRKGEETLAVSQIYIFLVRDIIAIERGVLERGSWCNLALCDAI